jgi:hypothetical protein
VSDISRASIGYFLIDPVGYSIVGMDCPACQLDICPKKSHRETLWAVTDRRTNTTHGVYGSRETAMQGAASLLERED